MPLAPGQLVIFKSVAVFFLLQFLPHHFTGTAVNGDTAILLTSASGLRTLAWYSFRRTVNRVYSGVYSGPSIYLIIQGHPSIDGALS